MYHTQIQFINLLDYGLNINMYDTNIFTVMNILCTAARSQSSLSVKSKLFRYYQTPNKENTLLLTEIITHSVNKNQPTLGQPRSSHEVQANQFVVTSE